MIRAFRPNDAPALAQLQCLSIAHHGPQAYTSKQVAAWLSRAWMAEQFTLSQRSGKTLRVAERGGVIAGYTIFEADGHLDHLYVGPDHTRMGVATALIADAEQLARESGCRRAFSEVSEIARPVFEHCGWRTTHRRDLTINGVAIHNYAMDKAIK